MYGPLMLFLPLPGLSPMYIYHTAHTTLPLLLVVGGGGRVKGEGRGVEGGTRTQLVNLVPRPSLCLQQFMCATLKNMDTRLLHATGNLLYSG